MRNFTVALILAATLATVMVTGMVTVVGCSDKSRRLNEVETLQYKRQLILDHSREISLEQVDLLGRHLGRTKGEIDAYFDDLRAQHAREVESGRADFEASRKKGTAPAASSPESR
jgi:hypothetical protein